MGAPRRHGDSIFNIGAASFMVGCQSYFILSSSRERKMATEPPTPNLIASFSERRWIIFFNK
jgi:hypothetical protein